MKHILRGELTLGSKETLRFKYMSSTQFHKLISKAA